MTGALHRTLVLLLLALAVSQAVLLARFEVNWDEFLNLSMLHDHRRGDLREVLQTAFIHLFHWVPSVSVNEVNEVLAARGIIAAFALVTSWAIWACARRLTSAEGALFAVFAYWSFGYVLQHGLALRTDTLAAAPIMVALWLVLARGDQRRAVAVAGLLVGVAGALTIKAIFFAPTLALVAWVRAAETKGWRASGTHLLLAAASAGLAFVVVIGLHALTFEEAASPLAFLQRTTEATLGDGDRSIFSTYTVYAIHFNPAFYLVLFMSIAVVVLGVTSRSTMTRGVIGIALLLPLLIPLVYRDVYPYFYALFLPPIAAAMAYGFDELRQRFPSVLVVVVMVVFVVFWALNFANAFVQSNAHQAKILRVIHDTFPQDSRYIDARSMVSSFKRKGIFMSTWGMTDYRAAGRPVMEDILRSDPPDFLLANGVALQLNRFTPETSEAYRFGLFAEDFRLLQENFVPFWGPIWVPGREIAPEDKSVEIFAPGNYVNKGPGMLEIEGKSLASDGAMALAAGTYAVSLSSAATIAMQFDTPIAEPPPQPVFRGFRYAPFSIFWESAILGIRL